MRAGLKRLLILSLTIIPAMLILPACDDDSPTTSNDDDTLRPTTVQKLLEEVFVKAYTERDSVLYESLLDPLYEFENLPADPDDPLNVELWGKESELRIAGRMFKGWSNPDGIEVLDITLDIDILASAVTTDFFQDRPEGEDWYKAATEVNLTVVTDDPAASDGTGIVNRIVYSGQDFWARPDPDDSDLWLLRRQQDEESIYNKETEQSNWGGIKGLFR